MREGTELNLPSTIEGGYGKFIGAAGLTGGGAAKMRHSTGRPDPRCIHASHAILFHGAEKLTMSKGRPRKSA